MRAETIQWKDGWFEVEIAIQNQEIDHLISLLQGLKADPEQHFHISHTSSSTGPVGQLTFFVQDSAAEDNLNLGSLALAPGDKYP